MGLSRPVPALSFEFTTIAREVAERCLDRLAALGPYGFDVALGETQRLTFGRWLSGRGDGGAPRRPSPRGQFGGCVCRAERLSMIPKSGYRFSEKIMLKQRGRAG